MLRRIGKAYLAVMPLVCSVVWAEPTAALKLASESFVAGRPFDVQLLVKGGECAEPEWSNTGFSVVVQDHQTVGSDTNQTHAFSFQLVPLHAGNLALPVFWVTCDEQDLETEPQVITVQKPHESSDLTVTATVSAQDVFVGQPIRYVAEWRVGFDPRQLRAVGMVHPVQSMGSLRVFDVVPISDKTIGLPVGNRRLMASQQAEEKDGKSIAVYRFEQIIVPQEAGPLALPPIRLICSRVPNAKGSFYQNVPSYFDNSFFEQVAAKEEFVEYYAETKPLMLTVKPLPVNDSATPFSGIVGSCELQVECGASEVKVGDPLPLKFRLITPFAQAFVLPDFRNFDALSRRFWIPEIQSEGRVENGARVYDQSVRPLHTGVQMVPPLELLIFNPASAQYERIASSAIALEVLPNEGETRFMPTTAAGTDTARELNPAGVWFNRDLSAGMLDRLTAWAVTFWQIWLIVPLLICLMLEPVARRVRLSIIDPARARALKAYPRFCRRLSKGAELETILQDYLAERFNRRSGTVTSGDVAMLLESQSITESVQKEVIALMLDLDQKNFSSESALQCDRNLAASMIRRLEREVS